MKIKKMFLLAFATLIFAESFAGTLNVTVNPNPFEQGSLTTFTIYLPQNETVRTLTIDFYSGTQFLFQVSPRITSPTTLYGWNGCNPNNNQCLPPGTYSYVVKAGCGCGGRSTYEATGNVTIVAAGGGTQPPSGCYATESECKNNNAHKCNCGQAVNCQYDSVNKCYLFSNCDNSKCASGGGGGTQPPTAKVSVTSFLQMIGQCGAINYAAIAECPTEGPTAYPEEGKLGYWCKVRNAGSPGQEGAIRYWAVLSNDPNNQYDDLSYEIYIFYAKRVCQNPPQAEYVGCDQCILLLENMNVVHEAPKSVVDGAIATLKRHQSCGGGGGGAPGPGPGPGPSTPAPPSSPSPQQSPAPVPSQEPPASGGGITADARPNPFQQGSTTTFTITAQSGQAISQIYIEIYDLTGSKVYDSGWVNGNKLVWNGIGNYGRWNNVALRTQAYIFVASAKVGSETKGPARGYVYIVPASGGPAKSPSPGTSQGPGGPAQSPGQSPGQPATQVPPGNECQTNADCVCNDACYNGRCIHPELTINGSANTLLAYTGKPLETTIVWTITNAGDDAAVLKDVKPSGCENVTCELQIQAGTTIKIAGNTNQELRKKDSKINLEGKDTKVIEKGLKLELQSNFKFDYGEVEVGLDWKAVKLKNIYTSPIVVAKPIESCSSNGKTQCDKVVVRIKNVQTNSFEIRLQKWGEGWNQPLTRNYKVQYLVLEEGTNDLNGLQIEAGKFKATQSVVFNIYKSKFSTTPILITSIATFNGSHPAVTRNRNPIPCVGVFALFCKIANFATNIQEEKTLLRYIHSEEEIHYVAISTGKAIIGDTQWEIRRIQGVNDEGTTIFYESDFPETPIVIADFQTVNDDDPIMLRYYKKERDSIHFFAAEEDSSLIDICWWCHRPEDVGYIAIAKTGSTGLKAVIETDKDGCTCPPCTINFDGSKSTGNIVSYEWDFGDNNAKATGQKVSYTYTKNGTYTVKLTVKDSNGNSASATKTITVSDCTQPIKGTVIEPGRSIKIIQKVKGLNPGKYEFDLQASYTDLFNASAKQTNEWKKIIVEVAKLGSEKFSVKLVGEEQDFCIGPNGLFGITGKAAVPKVKLSWQFEGDAAIKIDDCDDKGTDSFIYCDPTQFSIALAQKLKKIYELASNKRYAETKSYTSFKAHLIGDNYSENFQKDFVKAYTEGFLKAPTWFISGATPWSKYFSDPNALSFEPRQIDSGLYIVTLDINFNTEDWVFFREGKPDAKIKVKFEKVRDAAADVEEIPFYYLPFNGLVGKDGRTDYGIGYTNQNNPIVISVVGNADKIETSTPRGRMHISTAIYSELKDILNAQNNLFKVDLAGKKIELYISQPMPILMGIRSKNGRGECFYKIYSLQSAIGSGFDGISYWTGIATSPDLNCRDFSGLELPLKKKDTQAALIDSSCAAKKNNLPAFGFYWNGVPNNQSLFLSTVFYTPHGKKMSISNACSSDVCLLASKSGLSRDIGESLSLDSSLKAEKISEIIPLIEQEYVCIVPELEGVHPSQNSYVFFWNEQKLLKDLEIAKTRVASEWGFNWQNYKCD
ncbi:MAG: PKD domain-containing protein [Candidatus Diapherotrites archaeon]|nr:PKD domain-containing protein [Candidatus Diapherotrites archaeon]